jgi:hypothetical protein
LVRAEGRGEYVSGISDEGLFREMLRSRLMGMTRTKMKKAGTGIFALGPV